MNKIVKNYGRCHFGLLFKQVEIVKTTFQGGD
jgi:hypothetical protein